MDAVAIGSILAVIGAALVAVVLVVRVVHLINTTHSEDE
jgi:hypothetical protein